MLSHEQEVNARAKARELFYEPPVNILEICNTLGLFISWDNRYLDKTEEAVTILIDDQYFIFLNKRFKKFTCKIMWSISHELGHIYLGHFQKYDLTFSNKHLSRRNAWEINREANIFAEELLMPEWFVRSNIEKGFHYLKNTCWVAHKSLQVRLNCLKTADTLVAAAKEPTIPICLDDYEE